MNASDSAYGRTVRLLVADVTATLGAAHTAAVREIADGVQGLDLPDHSRKCVDDVQQYLRATRATRSTTGTAPGGARTTTVRSPGWASWPRVPAPARRLPDGSCRSRR